MQLALEKQDQRWFVAAVVVLICSLFLLLVRAVLMPWFVWTSTLGMIHFMIVMFWLFAVLSFYLLSVVTDPGHVPKGWVCVVASRPVLSTHPFCCLMIFLDSFVSQ
jgi:hypothetical protein